GGPSTPRGPAQAARTNRAMAVARRGICRNVDPGGSLPKDGPRVLRKWSRYADVTTMVGPACGWEERRIMPRRMVLAVLVVGMLGLSGVAVASHQFRDVPDDHVFHED